MSNLKASQILLLCSSFLWPFLSSTPVSSFLTHSRVSRRSTGDLFINWNTKKIQKTNIGCQTMDINTGISQKFKYANSRDIEAVHKQLELDGKRPLTTSTGAFLTTAVVGVPIFLSILPVTIAYQLGRSFIKPTASPDAALNDPMLASRDESTEETFPDLDEITPKHERKYDIVLLGCTGFTGRLAALYTARTYQGKNLPTTTSLGINY